MFDSRETISRNMNIRHLSLGISNQIFAVTQWIMRCAPSHCLPVEANAKTRYSRRFAAKAFGVSWSLPKFLCHESPYTFTTRTERA
jgi:hypothetical protein